jgi:hypothetical protein
MLVVMIHAHMARQTCSDIETLMSIAAQHNHISER